MRKINQKKGLQPKLNIKKGDIVKIIGGDDKDKEGRVLAVLIEKRRVFVEGVNIVSRHTKADQKNPQGGIVKKEAPVHISNLMLKDPSSGEAIRVGRKRENGKLVRYSKKSGQAIK